MSINLPIFGIEKTELRDFTTTERDMKKGLSKYPPPQYRLKGEDLMVEKNNTQMIKAEIDNTFTLLDDYNSNMQLRNMKYQESKNFEAGEDDEEEDEYYVNP